MINCVALGRLQGNIFHESHGLLGHAVHSCTVNDQRTAPLAKSEQSHQPDHLVVRDRVTPYEGPQIETLSNTC